MKFSSIVRMIGRLLIVAGCIYALIIVGYTNVDNANDLAIPTLRVIVMLISGYALYEYGKKINSRKRWVVYKIQNGIKYFISLDDGDITTDESKVYKFNYYKDVAVFIPYRK